MADGDYPLKVCVTNKFGLDGNEGPTIQVVFHQYPYKLKDRGLQEYTHTIGNGATLCFPLLWGEEFLEISIKGTFPRDIYYIWAGIKTKCYIEVEEQDPEPEYTPSPIGKLTKFDDTFYCGGTWKFNKENTSWKLNIKKYTFDPEEDEVIVGPDTPG